ncbi:MAG: EFR1 family ferrodoxin [Desulfosporosinus sp.]|nr:EFR1 family ferrodoxin [Desulfosporosinus sp.]
MNKTINSLYFSATDTTKKIVSGIAKGISATIEGEMTINTIDFTLPKVRIKAVSFSERDIVVIGVPVYAGRVPNVLLNYLNSLTGNGALAIPVVVYGNRNYDDALIELTDILEFNGFKVIAGGAFIGEHSFSVTLAKNRPDEQDMAIVSDFSKQISTKIITQERIHTVAVNGNRPYRNYYMPLKKDGSSVDLRKVVPKTNSNCLACKLCVNACPMGSIDAEDVSKLIGICIKCGACIKKCPAQAKYYDDKDYLRHKQELEIEYTSRRVPELFL